MATEREMGIGEKEEVFSSCKDRHFSPNVLYVREDPSSSFPAIWLHLLCSHSLLSSSYVSTNSVCVARLRGGDRTEIGKKEILYPRVTSEKSRLSDRIRAY